MSSPSANIEMRRHWHWVLLLICAPATYFGFMWLGGLFAQQAEHHGPGSGGVGWWFAAAAMGLAAVITPVVFLIRAVVQMTRTYRRAQRAKGRFTRGEQRLLAQGSHAAQAWEHARRVRAELLSQRVPGALEQWDVVPYDGERFFARLTLTYARYYGRDVTASQSSAFAWGSPAFVVGVLAVSAMANASARSKAAAEAAPQWREWQPATVYVSNYRLVVHASGQWLTFGFDAMSAVYPEIGSRTLVCQFGDAEPLLLSGAEVPVAAVFTVLQTYGRDALARHPAMQVLDLPAAEPALPPVGGRAHTA